MRIVVGSDAEGAATEAARWIARRLADAVRRRGGATIAFSGGSTPVPMFAALARAELPWPAVHVFQVDERVAPDGDPDRNVGLLAGLPLSRRNLHPMPVTAASLAAAARRYGAALPERFDVVHLGFGDDGHTASWPPGDPVVGSRDPVAVVGPFNGRMRMTLTPPVVNAARARLVLSVGAAKAAVVRRWLDGDRTLPNHHVRHSATWLFADPAAAGEIAH